MNRKHLLLIVLIIGMFSCKKSDRDEDNSTNTSSDLALATTVIYNVFKTVHQASYYSQGIIYSSSIDTNSVYGCDTIITDTTSNPKKLTIDFRTGCSTSNAVRSGKIIVTINGYYQNLNTTVNVSFSEFIFNGNHISGNFSYQYVGLTDSFPSFNFTLNEFKLKNKLNQYINISGEHQLKIISGHNNQLIEDDNYSITGYTSGRVFKGNGFSSQIITNLGLAGNCNWINSGVVTVKPENNPTRTLDFGSGCDSKINVKVYDINYELELP